MTQEQRKYPRTPIALVVNLQFENGHEVEVETWNISHGGISIQFDVQQTELWYLNQKVIAKVKGLPVEGPAVPMTVVRITNNCIGLAMTEN